MAQYRFVLAYENTQARRARCPPLNPPRTPAAPEAGSRFVPEAGSRFVPEAGSRFVPEAAPLFRPQETDYVTEKLYLPLLAGAVARPAPRLPLLSPSHIAIVCVCACVSRARTHTLQTASHHAKRATGRCRMRRTPTLAAVHAHARSASGVGPCLPRRPERG